MDIKEYKKILDRLYSAAEEGVGCTEIIQQMINAQIENQELLDVE